MAVAAPLAVGINGFGSIGRRFFRQAEGRPELSVVAVNDIGDLPTLAHLLKYDSSYGPFAAEVALAGGDLAVAGRHVRVFRERDPGAVPWGEVGVDVVLEATGLWTDRRAAQHITRGGARQVVVSAPGSEEDVTLVMGVNEDEYDPARHRVISGASCTTQCLAVLCRVLDDAFGLRRALCSTVHAYTNDQRLLDLPHRDLRRARGAGLNIIPLASGAARAVEKAIPHLRGRIGASSFRVPTASVSVLDVVADLGRPAGAEEINAAFEAAAGTPRLRGRLGVSREALVSQDFRGDSHSAVVDLPLTQVVDGTLSEVVAWYDNEWGYSARLVDLMVYLAEGGPRPRPDLEVGPFVSPAFRKKTLRDIPLAGRTALVRVDFNVPLDGQRVADDTRIAAALPTLRHLIGAGAKVVLCSHLGRPAGRRVPSLSLKPVLAPLQAALDQPVAFSPDAVGPRARRVAEALPPGRVALLENTRFYPEEERNDGVFARALAALGHVFIQDAFGAVHRAHASTVGVAAHLPAVSGLLVEREVQALGRLLDAPRPFVAIIGGAKVSDKIGVLEHLLPGLDRLLIGGGMANTFLAALGYPMGRSAVEAEQIPAAERLIAEARRRGTDLLLPVDLVVGNFFLPNADYRIVQVGQVPPEWTAMDIGPLTVERFAAAMRGARTIFWNGPLGVAEWANFAAGTAGVARALAACPDAFTVVGGGDSIAALRRQDLAGRIGHLSTGGGASLEFLEGRDLPGIACLEDR